MSPDLHHLSGAYAVDALDDAERADFERHLAACATCRDEVAELAEAAQRLGALTEATPPERLRASVLAGIRQVRPLPPPAGAAVTSRGVDEDAGAPTPPPAPGDGARHAAPTTGGTGVPFLRRTSTWLAAAAAVVLLTVGGLVWQPWNTGRGTLTAVEQVQQAPDATTATSDAGGVKASLEYSRSLDRSALTVSGLPPAPSGSTYQLWYIPASGDPRSAGFLTATGAGSPTLLEGDIGNASAVGVSLEPAGGSAAPTTDPVVVVSLS
jgi:anti-sigma-K factor RskA